MPDRARACPALGAELYGAALLRTEDIEEMRGRVESRLRKLADEVARRSGIAVAVAILDGSDIADLVEEHIERSGSDLVAMTTHHRGRVERLLLGSVSDAIVRTVEVPVLLVSPARAPASLNEERSIAHILVPHDGSAFAERIISHATTLAHLLHARLTLLSVVEPVLAAASVAVPAGSAGLIRSGDEGDEPRWDSPALDAAADALRAQGLGVQTAVVVDGQPARAIVDYAEKHSVDLIAMTTHGRGAVKRLFIGSVAQHVLQNTPTAMLMLRPAETT